MQFSFIDFAKKDFLRDTDGFVIIIIMKSFLDAEDWLLNNGTAYGWQNSGTRIWCWDEEE